MPITSSAKKALKRDRVLGERNAYFKIAMKRAIKTFRKAVADKTEVNELKTLFVQAQVAIDKAAKRNIVHKANASRKISRLATVINNIA